MDKIISFNETLNRSFLRYRFYWAAFFFVYALVMLWYNPNDLAIAWACHLMLLLQMWDPIRLITLSVLIEHLGVKWSKLR